MFPLTCPLLLTINDDRPSTTMGPLTVATGGDRELNIGAGRRRGRYGDAVGIGSGKGYPDVVDRELPQGRLLRQGKPRDRRSRGNTPSRQTTEGRSVGKGEARKGQ